MSFLFRLFRRLRTPRGFVGHDLEGNQFFEHPGVHDGRTKRVVKYAEGRDMWAYVGGRKRLAVQWTAWLTHTRPHPPTLEELHADLERQRRVLFNAALIEARDREEKARIAASELATPPVQEPLIQTSHVTQDHASQVPEEPPFITPVAQAMSRPSEQSVSTQPSPWKPPPRDEPHSWQPRASVQRGR
ncbi:hypothetical protein C8Q79DRAFT_225297 [Trametes meyenii]|nr:hypothetical protein C8Q79DRAFT_225297 [Trametes meyenii]